MKNIIFIFILLFCSSFVHAQLFKGKPEKISDLNFYPKIKKHGSFSNEQKIIRINEINLPIVEKVFSGAKLYDIVYEKNDFIGIYEGHFYYMKYKGTYYNKNEYLSELELKTNKNKLSPLSLKERIEAYATVCAYRKLQKNISIDSLIIYRCSPDSISYIDYKVIYNVEGKSYIGGVKVKNNDINFLNIYFDDNTLIYEDFINSKIIDKSAHLNIITTEPAENYNSTEYYYFDADNSTNARIEITGLNQTEHIELQFYRAYESIIDIYSVPLIAYNGTVNFNYSQIQIATGVYKLTVVHENGMPEDFNVIFAPEHRIEGPLSSSFNYKIYYTDMFYNSASLNISESDFVNAVKDAVKKSYQKEVTEWGFCSNMDDANHTMDVYLHNYFESGFKYHKASDNVTIDSPLAFFQNNNDYLIEMDFNFQNIGNLTNLTYTNTEDFIHSGISHEFFHAVQQTIRGASSNLLSNADMYWLTEGTARFIQTVFMHEVYGSDVEFSQGAAYNYNANKFLSQRLYTSANYATGPDIGALAKVSYDYCLFWRFLYEKNKPNATVTEKLKVIKDALSNAPSSYNVSKIRTNMNDVLQSNHGSFTDFTTAINQFAKYVYFIHNTSANWDFPNSYDNSQGIEQITVNSLEESGTPFTKTINMSAGFGISIQEISLPIGNYELKLDNTSDNFNVNEFVCGGAGFPDNNIHVHNSQDEIIPFQIQSSASHLVIIFVNTKISSIVNDPSSSITYKIYKPSNNVSTLNVDFEPKNSTINAGNSVQFHNTSTSTDHDHMWVANWWFEGGTPEISHEQNPIITYNSEGSYRVTLEVWDDANHSNREILNCVNVVPVNTSGLVADFTYSVDPYDNNNIYFQDLSSSSATSWEWDFGDGYTSTDRNTTHRYNNYGTYNVNLIINSQDGSAGVSKTIEVTSQGEVSISGQALINFTGASNVIVNAIDDNNDLINSAVTEQNGSFTLEVPYNWSGKIVAIKSGYYCTPSVYQNLTYSVNNVNLYLYPLQLQITSSQVTGTYYKFEATHAPIGTVNYHWLISPNPYGETVPLAEDEPLGIFYQFFDCNPQQDITYNISVEAITDAGQVFAATPIDLPIYHCTNVTSAVTYPNNCKAYRLGQSCPQIQDISSPFTDISRVMIWFGGGSSCETYDTRYCNFSGCFAPDHSVYAANCRTFEHCFDAQGVYSGYLTASDLNGATHNSACFDMLVVNCILISNNFDNHSLHYLDHNNNVDYYYAGEHDINSLANINNYQNKNVTVYACNEINLDGDFDIETNIGYEMNLEIDPCLYQDESKQQAVEEEITYTPYQTPEENKPPPMTIPGIVNIYPNPNQGQFVIEAKNSEISSIQIYNSMGQPLKTFYNTESTLYMCDISAYSPGMYYVKVNTASKVYVFKIIYSKIL